jgi:hypothetical protein
MISHRALTLNLAVNMALAKVGPESVLACWLPQYHDYGLVANFFLPLQSGCHTYAFSPLVFIKDPLMWPRLIARYNATHMTGPNFGYGLTAKRMAASSESFDLSSLQHVNIAAEVVVPATLDAMQRDMGIAREKICPTYGLAENVITVTVGEISICDGVVSSGRLSASAPFGKFVTIVDPETRAPLGEGEAGLIYARGPDMASGYWRRPELTEQMFHNHAHGRADWLNTGDLGYVKDDMLYLTGRQKEVMIIGGKNYYPTDVERTLLEQFPVLRPGSIAAFQSSSTGIGVVAMPRKGTKAEAVPSAAEVRQVTSAAHGLNAELILITREPLPKTTSGKLRRVSIRRRSLANEWRAKERVVDWAATGISRAASPAESGMPAMTASSIDGAVVVHVPGESTHKEVTLALLLSVLREAMGDETLKMDTNIQDRGLTRYCCDTCLLLTRHISRFLAAVLCTLHKHVANNNDSFSVCRPPKCWVLSRTVSGARSKTGSYWPTPRPRPCSPRWEAKCRSDRPRGGSRRDTFSSARQSPWGGFSLASWCGRRPAGCFSLLSSRPPSCRRGPWGSG